MVKNIQHIFRLILPLLCALFFLDAQASLQQPVQVTAVMIPPYGNYLSDYYAGTEERMSVTLLNRDVMQPEIRVKLRLTIRTSSGATLTTRPEAYFPPIALESNVPRRLMMTDLAPYFSRGSLSNANALANETLPEGFCQFTIEAVEYYTGRTVSGKTTAVAFLQMLKPAKLISPTNKENVLFQEPLNLVFRWQPVTSSGYGAPEYEFTLKEIDDKQANVEAAFLYARTVYQTTTQNTLLPYTADLPMLENGKRYAWQVKASLPTETKNRFQNNGYSEVWLFDLREDCKPPMGLTAEPTHDMMLLKWQPAQGAANYNIQYRREDFDSNVWHDKPADAANSLINDIAQGHSYVFRVGSVCEDGNVVYSTEKTAFMPLQDEEQIKNCGKEPDIDLSNREPKEYLGIGDVFYCADYPVTITEVTGGNGLFSGKGYAPFPLFGALPVNVTFSNVSINADNHMTEGSVAAVRDEGNSLMSNLDRLTEGGTQKLAQGIIKPDIIVDYAIPPTATLTYDSIADTYTIEDENHQPIGNLQMPKNDQGEPVFPVIVKDADENIYRIEETKDESGAKKGGFTFTPLGRQMDPIDFNGIKKDVCDWDYGVVVFTESLNTKYALDGALPYYNDCAIIRCHADAQKENGGRLYNAYASINNVEISSKWKFMATGETDEVLATIDIRNDGLEPGKVLFANAQGVVFPSVYDAKKKTYAVTLTGTEAGTAMTVYALYKAKDGYKSLGYMHVDTRAKMPQQNVVIVNATGKALKEDIAATLNAIYGKVGVQWNVQEISDFNYPKEELSQVFDEKSSLISQYNDAQKAVIAAFEDHLGDRYDSRTSYVFLFASGESKNRDVAGFMPRGRQYCFIDTKAAGDLGATIAHELGHGRFNLKHPFDDCYGRAAKDSRGTTPLLMDYTDGTSIAKWQWSEIYQPALIGAVFEREEKGMLINETWLTPDWVPFKFDASNVICHDGTYLQGTVDGILYNKERFLYDSSKKAYYSELSQTSLPINLNESPKNDTEIYVYEYNGGCGKDKYYVTTWEYLNTHKNNIDFQNASVKFKKIVGCYDTEPSKTYFEVKDNVAQEYIDDALNHSKKVGSLQSEEIVNQFVEKIRNYSTSQLGDILADKLNAYEKLNHKKFYVVPLAVNVININQISWNALAKAVFEKAGLSEKDILITLPYVQCKGMDLGEFYFMPGIHYGNEVKIDIQSLRNDYDNTQKAVELNVTGTVSHDIGRFILDVFTKTSKKVIVHRGIFLSTNTIQYEHWEKDDISGYPFNTQIRLYHEAEYDKLVRLRDKYKYMHFLSGTPEILDEDRYELEELSRKYLVEYESTIKELAQNYQNGSGKLVSYELKNIRFREEYLNEPNRELNLPEAEAYITEGAFRELQKELDYPKNNSYSPNQQYLFSNATDYLLAPWDDAIYNTLDISGLALSIVGLDFLTDGVECIYACFRGDGTTIAAAGAALFIEGANARVVKEGFKLSKESVLKISKNGDVSSVKISDLGVDATTIAKPIDKYPDLKIRLQSLPDGGKQFIDDFADASDDVLKKFVEKPELVDAWKKIRTANPEVSKNIGALEALNAPKGSRPAPRTYLGDKFVDSHLSKFKNDGCAFVIKKSDIENLEYNSLPPKKFVALKSDMEKIISDCKGNRSLLAKKLGYEDLTVFDNEEIFVVYTKENSSFKFDIPSGNEKGANEMWIPGGKTSGGTTEAVLVGSDKVIHNNDWNTFTSFFDNVEPIK